MTTLHGGYDYLVISVHFIFDMSAVVNMQVVLKDVRDETIENIMEAISYGLKLDQFEKDLMQRIFQINLEKLAVVSGEDIKNMNDLQFKFVECELLLKIAKKMKLMLMSIEEFLCHDAIVNANFQYDTPQQQIWNEIQTYLNQMRASGTLDQVLGK